MQRLMVVLDNVKAYQFKTLRIDDFSCITQIKLVLLLLLPFIIYFYCDMDHWSDTSK